MAIGYLMLDPEYINTAIHKNPTGQWRDEPENTVVTFQFDPTDVKFKVATKWKKGDPKTDSFDDLTIMMGYDPGIKRLESMRLRLMFSDHAPYMTEVKAGQEIGASGSARNRTATGKDLSTQRSLEILEAMALPVRDLKMQTIAASYETHQYIEIQTPKLPPEPGAFASKLAWTVWRNERDRRIREHVEAGKKVEVLDVTEATDAQGTRMIPAWHPPRPLLLRLLTQERWQCVIQNLEFEILTMDSDTGVPTSAIAIVTLMEFDQGFFTEGYDGLIKNGVEDVSKSISLKEWNLKVRFGNKEITETVPSRSSIIKKPYKARKNPKGQ